MVFCYKNCSDLLWEKIVLVIEKNLFLIAIEKLYSKKKFVRKKVMISWSLEQFFLTVGQNNFRNFLKVPIFTKIEHSSDYYLNLIYNLSQVCQLNSKKKTDLSLQIKLEHQEMQLVMNQSNDLQYFHLSNQHWHKMGGVQPHRCSIHGLWDHSYIT